MQSLSFLAHPRTLLDACEDPREAGRVIPLLVGAVVVGGALFGFSVGAFHGGWQALYAAAKMPLVLAAPLLVTLPALRVLHGDVSLQRAGLAALLCTARVAVLAAALAPVMWLICSLDPPYAVAVLGMVAALVLIGLPNLVALARLLSPEVRVVPMLATVMLVGVVLAQTGWLLRPFVVTPGAAVTFLCPLRGDILDGLWDRVVGTVNYEEESL